MLKNSYNRSREKSSTKELSSDKKKEYHGEERSGTMEKDHTQMTKRMLLSIMQLMMPLSEKSKLFENKLYFSLEIMFVFKVRQLVEFLKKARLLHEKRQ